MEETTMTKSDDKCFVKITNMKIYERIEEYQKANTEQHNAIIQRLDITNGKVKLAKLMATTAFSVVMITLGFLVSHLLK
jgi:hypothetical protein